MQPSANTEHSGTTGPRLAEAPAPGAPRRSGRPWKLLVILAVLAAAGWAGYQLYTMQKVAARATTPVAIPTTAATSGTLVRTVRVAGQTSARSFANITAPMMRGGDRNIVLMRMVRSGTVVTAGQELAAIDGQSAQDRLDDLNDSVRQAEVDVRRRQAEQAVSWFRLQQTLSVAKAELDKAKLELGAAEVRTAVDQELLKLQVEELEARFKQLKADEANTKASLTAELKILELSARQTAQRRDRQATDISRFTIRSPMNGLAVASSIYRGGEMAQIQQGDQVSPGQPIMKVVDVSTMQVEAQISQAESSQLRLGQKATIRLDAFPDLVLKGKVYSIGALATGGGRQNFFVRNIPVRIQIDGTDPRLIPDLSASAEIEVDREENATMVPLNTIFAEDGRSFVYVRSGKEFQKKEVELGLENATHVAVLKGLSAGEQVRLR